MVWERIFYFLIICALLFDFPLQLIEKKKTAKDILISHTASQLVRMNEVEKIAVLRFRSKIKFSGTFSFDNMKA